MLGANLFPLLEIERKREDAYSKTRKKITIVAETFYKWTYLSVNVQTPFCSREGAQRTGENHQRLVYSCTPLFETRISTAFYSPCNKIRSTRRIKTKGFRDCLWSRDRINIAERKAKVGGNMALRIV